MGIQRGGYGGFYGDGFMGMYICHITWSILLWYSGYGYAGYGEWEWWYLNLIIYGYEIWYGQGQIMEVTALMEKEVENMEDVAIMEDMLVEVVRVDMVNIHIMDMVVHIGWI
eukprot:379588_1